MNESTKTVTRKSGQYMTAERMESLLRYLADCKAGLDVVEVWDRHKQRMSTQEAR